MVDDRGDRLEVSTAAERREEAMTVLSDLEQTAARAPEYEQARAQVEKKRKFRADLVAYVVINAFLLGAWAATGFGYFWPGWVLAGWGALLLLDGWNVFYRRPVTDADIEKELDRGG
jgi:2TM domain